MGQQNVDLFVGRQRELGLVSAAAEEARRGRPGVVVVSGSAGSGKTAFVREAVRPLRDFTRLWLAGDASAGDQSMWLLGQLVDVPARQSTFGVGLSLLNMLGEQQAEGPVVLVVEDLHWADNGSQGALLSALRRLDGDRVLAVVTTRPDGQGGEAWQRFVQDGERGQLVELGPLTAPDVATLADQLRVPLGPNAAVRLQRHTRGHALYVRTLLRELAPSQLNAYGSLPAPRSLASATVQAVGELPRESVDLLQALAVLGRPGPLAVLGSMAAVPDASAALEGALVTGLVTWEPRAPGLVVRFAHPLYGAAVYDDIPPVRRRELHLAAAGADPASSLTHRIAAADRADPALAAELEEAARAASDPALAARYLGAAADLSVSAADAESRLLAAGARLLASGDVRAMAQLRSRLESLPPGVERDLLLGWLAWQAGDIALAESLLRGAADRVPGDRRSADPLLQLGTLYAFQLRGQDALRAGEAVLELTGIDTRRTELALRIIAAGVNTSAGGVAACAVLDRGYGGGVDQSALDPDVKYAYAVYETSAGRFRSALAWVDRLGPDIRRGEIAWHLPHLQMMRSQCHYALGQWDEALLHANTGIDLANDQDQRWVVGRVHAVAAWVHGGRGQWEIAERRLQYARGATDQGAEILTRMADGFLARARGRPADVVAALQPLTLADGSALPPASNLMFWPALVHALIDTGDQHSAQRELAALLAAAATRQVDLTMQVRTLHARLLVADGSADAASEAFADACRLIGDDSDVLEQVVLRHAFGLHLRATGRRREAITQLAAGYALASGLNAVPYAERIDADLRRWEAKYVPLAIDDPFATLTSRERDVVTLIARGATNREAAGSLYVTVKAVEYHLSNVYAKLRITSRRQLRDLVDS